MKQPDRLAEGMELTRSEHIEPGDALLISGTWRRVEATSQTVTNTTGMQADVVGVTVHLRTELGSTYHRLAPGGLHLIMVGRTDAD